jgi:hypothetical protein
MVKCTCCVLFNLYRPYYLTRDEKLFLLLGRPDGTISK